MHASTGPALLRNVENSFADVKLRKAGFLKSQSQSMPSVTKLASRNSEEELINSGRTARFCKNIGINPSQLPHPTKFVRKKVDTDFGSFPDSEAGRIQQAKLLLFGAASEPDLFRRNAST